MNIELLKVTPKVFNTYRQFVKGNENITLDQVRKKSSGKRVFQYGNLLIVLRKNTVIHIWNNRGVNNYSGWEFDPFKYVELTRALGLVD